MSLPLSPSAPLDDEQLEEKLNWLDRLRAESGVPESVDLDDAVLVHNNISDEDVSPTTYRRWPVEYFMMGRERRYFVAIVVAFAKKRFEDAAAVPRIPPPRRRRKSVITATPTPSV